MIGRILCLLGRGATDMRRRPLAQILTLATVSLVALLAGLFLLALHNFQLELLRNRGRVQFQIYWSQNADMELVKKQWTQLARMDRLERIATFTPEQALQDLSTTLDAGDGLLQLEGDSPLPPTASLSFAVSPDQQDEGWAKRLLSELKALPQVAEVHFDPMQYSLAQNWLEAVQRVVWPIIAFFGLVAAMVVGNTVRLSLLTRGDEVEILHLVGARPWYIRLPLLSTGAIQGLLGGLIGLGLLKLVQLGVQDALAGSPLALRVEFLPLNQAAGLACAAVLVGLASSWVAVRS
ncbi:MAG: cell division transport system permease protein [Desulfovibrionales bacterium]|nr:cell division transport system permease protein [Desulfovibrionales bacterium]